MASVCPEINWSGWSYGGEWGLLTHRETFHKKLPVQTPWHRTKNRACRLKLGTLPLTHTCRHTRSHPKDSAAGFLNNATGGGGGGCFLLLLLWLNLPVFTLIKKVPSFCPVNFEEQYGSRKKKWRKGDTARKTATRESIGATGSAMDLSIQSHQRLGSTHVGKVLDVLTRTVPHKSDDLMWFLVGLIDKKHVWFLVYIFKGVLLC